MSINMRIFLGGVLTGSPHSRKRHLMQADVIQDAIELRWKRDHPASWQAKHLRWFLQEQAKSASPETAYRYWLTARLLVQRLDKTNDWLPHLNGTWTQKPKPKGPRPESAAVAFSKAMSGCDFTHRKSHFIEDEK